MKTLEEILAEMSPEEKEKMADVIKDYEDRAKQIKEATARAKRALEKLKTNKKKMTSQLSTLFERLAATQYLTTLNQQLAKELETEQ